EPASMMLDGRIGTRSTSSRSRPESRCQRKRRRGRQRYRRLINFREVGRGRQVASERYNISTRAAVVGNACQRLRLEPTPYDNVRRDRRPAGYANHPRLRGKHLKAMTCGEAVMKLLSAYEVDTVFGMAGTMTLEVYRGIAQAGIRHVQCRNEQGASFMADGYARATGKPGVCTIIGGPGVTNAATGIAQAYCDSQPMLVLSGASPALTQGKGWGAIHELNDQ